MCINLCGCSLKRWSGDAESMGENLCTDVKSAGSVRRLPARGNPTVKTNVPSTETTETQTAPQAEIYGANPVTHPQRSVPESPKSRRRRLSLPRESSVSNTKGRCQKSKAARVWRPRRAFSRGTLERPRSRTFIKDESGSPGRGGFLGAPARGNKIIRKAELFYNTLPTLSA